MTTRTARLAGGVPAVDHDHDSSSAGGLVLQHRPETTPAQLGDRARQGSVADHVGHGEVLNADPIETAHQISADLVQEIAARVPNAGVAPRHLDSLLGAIRGSALAARQTPLVAEQATFAVSHVVWVRNALPRG